MSVQTRTTALQGEFVRLYCTFEMDGMLVDPGIQPWIEIVDYTWNQASSSSSSSSSLSSLSSIGSSASSSSIDSTSSSESSVGGHTFGTFYAQREHIGIWYVDWFVPLSLSVGKYYDIWRFQFVGGSIVERRIFEIDVHTADSYIQWISPPIAQQLGETAVSMLQELNNSLVFEAQHIPNYWEQGYPIDTNTLNFAYKNWNTDPKPLLRKNNRLVQTGWTLNYDGLIRLESNIRPDDSFFAGYNFRYFSDEELLTFLNEGLYMMNATPPASQTYMMIAQAPFVWRAGITLYASIAALRRLVFGLEFQERGIIFGEDWNQVNAVIGNLRQLYNDYMTLWMEIRKDIKKKLPSIYQSVSPEYTLPGGRCCSSDTCITYRTGGIVSNKTISEIYNVVNSGKHVEVLSMNRQGDVVFSKAEKIWKSGIKLTYLVATETRVIRLSEDHLVFNPTSSLYIPVKHLDRDRKVVLLEASGGVKIEKLVHAPIPYRYEPTYDIEVPDSENFFGNEILSHNSRWFRYLYKA